MDIKKSHEQQIKKLEIGSIRAKIAQTYPQFPIHCAKLNLDQELKMVKTMRAHKKTVDLDDIELSENVRWTIETTCACIPILHNRTSIKEQLMKKHSQSKPESFAHEYVELIEHQTDKIIQLVCLSRMNDVHNKIFQPKSLCEKLLWKPDRYCAIHVHGETLFDDAFLDDFDSIKKFYQLYLSHAANKFPIDKESQEIIDEHINETPLPSLSGCFIQ